MAVKALPTPALIRQLMEYSPETGELRWCARTEADFAPDRAQSPAERAVGWNKRFAGKPALSYLDPVTGYRRGTYKGMGLIAHRVAWAIYHGEWPCGEIDHINGQRADNRIENLRVVNSLENRRNMKRPADNTSGFIGVSFDKRAKKWEAHIGYGGSRKRFLGYFNDKEAAHAARRSAEMEMGFHPNHGRAG